jgi:hypothetical protein
MFALADDPTTVLYDRTVHAEEFGFRTESVVEEPFPIDDPAPGDPIARIEEKLDAALRAMAVMQQRIESLDTTLMRVLTR